MEVSLLLYSNYKANLKVKVLVTQFSLFQFSPSVVSDSLWPHESQHTRPPCPSPTRGVYPKPCPLSRWCHPTISSSVVPFSYCPQSFTSIRVFSNESALRIRWPKYCPTLCNPIDYSPPGSSVHGIIQTRIWSGLPFPSPGDIPDPGIKSRFPTLQTDSLLSEPQGSQSSPSSDAFPGAFFHFWPHRPLL